MKMHEHEEMRHESLVSIDAMIRNPEKYKEAILERVQSFFEVRGTGGRVQLVGSLDENLLERKFMGDDEDDDDDDDDDEMSTRRPLYIVFTNPEKTEIRVEERSADEIWDEIWLIDNKHNFNLLWEHLRHYDDFDVYEILPNFWHLMNDSQKLEYVENASAIFDHPHFLLETPDYLDSLDLTTLIGYMNTWSGGVIQGILEKIACEYWDELDEAGKATWRKRVDECPEEDRDGLLNLLD
ncbi:MAG: hypothetical protein LBG04_01980 [Holosporaceae bacterium]|jgi:hypothetical protein|nr:hypothetical protein [Holosporaceae bacterium]